MGAREVGYLLVLRRRSRKGIAREEVAAWAAARPGLTPRPAPGGALELWAEPPGKAPLLVWEEGEVWVRAPSQQADALTSELCDHLQVGLTCEETAPEASPAEERATMRRRRREGQARARREAWRARLLWTAVIVVAALIGWFLPGRSSR